MRDDVFDAELVRLLPGLSFTAGWGRALTVLLVPVEFAPVTEPKGGPLTLRMLREGWRVVVRVGPPGPAEDLREAVTGADGCCCFGQVRPGDRVKVILAERL